MCWLTVGCLEDKGVLSFKGNAVAPVMRWTGKQSEVRGHTAYAALACVSGSKKVSWRPLSLPFRLLWRHLWPPLSHRRSRPSNCSSRRLLLKVESITWTVQICFLTEMYYSKITYIFCNLRAFWLPVEVWPTTCPLRPIIGCPSLGSGVRGIWDWEQIRRSKATEMIKHEQIYDQSTLIYKGQRNQRHWMGRRCM